MTEEFQRGVIPLARYQEQQLPEYQDNPLMGFYAGTAEISVTPISARQPAYPSQ